MSDAKPPSPPAQAPKPAGEGDVKDAKGPVAVDNAKGPGTPTIAGSAGSPATIGSAGAGASPGLTHPGVGPVPGNPGMPINPNPLVPADPYMTISGAAPGAGAATTHAGHADFAPDMPPKPIRVPAGDPGSDPRARGATVEKVDPVVALRNVDVRKVAAAMRRAAIDSEGPTQAGPDGGATVGHDGGPMHGDAHDGGAHNDAGLHRARMALGSLLPARVLAFLKDAQDDEVAALLEFARQRLAVEMARAMQIFAGTGG